MGFPPPLRCRDCDKTWDWSSPHAAALVALAFDVADHYEQEHGDIGMADWMRDYAWTQIRV